MTPYLTLIKVGAILLLIAALFAIGYRQGAKSVQADWDAAKVLQLKLSLELSQKHAKEVSDLADKYHRRNLEVSNAHQDAISAINSELAAARRAARTSGLRVPISICTPSAAKTDGNVRDDAATTATVALPQEITDNLFDLAAEADRVTEIARSCQDWVRKSGFYGKSQ